MPSEPTTDQLSDARFLRAARHLLGLDPEQAADALGADAATLAWAESRVSTRTVMTDPAVAAFAAGYASALEARGFRLSAVGGTVEVSFGTALGRDHHDGVAMAAAARACNMKTAALARASGASHSSITRALDGQVVQPSELDRMCAAFARRGVEVALDADGMLCVRFGDDGSLTARRGATHPDAGRRPSERAYGEPSLRVMAEVAGSLPRVWRELVVPPASTAEELQTAIDAAFGWDVPAPSRLVGQDGAETLPSSVVRDLAGNLPVARRDGFTVTLAHVGQHQPSDAPWVCDGHGPCPLSGTGDVSGHDDLVHFLASRHDRERKKAVHALRSFGDPWDADFESFDADEANARVEEDLAAITRNAPEAAPAR